LIDSGAASLMRAAPLSCANPAVRARCPGLRIRENQIPLARQLTRKWDVKEADAVSPQRNLGAEELRTVSLRQ